MPSEPRTILVIAVPMMGDVLLSTPLIRSVKARWPDAQVDVLTPPGGAAVLEGNPDVRECLAPPKKPVSKLATFVLSRFRRYDLVLSNSASDRAFIYALVMGKTRISLVYELHSNMALKQRFYRHWSIIDYERYHTIVQNLKLVDELDVDKLYDVTLPARDNSAATLAAVLGDDWREQEYAVIHPDTAAPYKRWHKTGWHAVVRELADRGLRVLITGGPRVEDIAYIDETLELTSGPAESLAGRISLADVALLLQHCRLYLGVDTLVSHMAAAAGAPSIVIFGPINPLTWAPWPRDWQGGDSPWQKIGSQHAGNVSVVQGRKHCVPCDKYGCLGRPDSHSECLDTLEASRITNEIRTKLDRPAT